MARARKKPAKRTSTKRKPKAAKAKPKAAKPKSRAAAKPARKPVKQRAAKQKPQSRRVARKREAVPSPVPDQSSEGSETGRRSALTARERSVRSSPVVEILDDEHPIGALRRFLDSIHGPATAQQAQIALGSAQLMLLPIAREHRGEAEVKELVDLMAQRWADFGDRRTGFHAQEFLRNAFAAVGVDRARIATLESLVPDTASTELLFNVASAHAIARDKVAMLRAVDAALDAGVASSQFRRDHDFSPYAGDPDFTLLLARADVPVIPVDVEPYLGEVRAALDTLVGTLRELGERIELRPPGRLDAILDAERARKISLPNDYRALLTITNGMKLWDHEFFGAGDYRELTPLAVRAQMFLQLAAGNGATIEECLPVASLPAPDDWLLYDPRGRLRGGGPGYVLITDGRNHRIDSLAAVLLRLERIARDALGTN